MFLKTKGAIIVIESEDSLIAGSGFMQYRWEKWHFQNGWR
jgi:hypothetical protein